MSLPDRELLGCVPKELQYISHISPYMCTTYLSRYSKSASCTLVYEGVFTVPSASFTSLYGVFGSIETSVVAGLRADWA